MSRFSQLVIHTQLVLSQLEHSQDLNSGLRNFKVRGTKDSVSWMAPFTTAQTCVMRAWDRSKPLLFCPAMNTAMWEHPITAQQVDQLKAFGYVEIPCVAKKLVCGDEGWTAVVRSWLTYSLDFPGLRCSSHLSHQRSSQDHR
eukprot:XP_016877952.1 phosphopantothenoylcysteine decarboxylase isoform X4 [Homo sapiens]